MTAARLTRNIREALMEKLITRAFQEPAQAMVERQCDFAHRVYQDALKPHLDHIATIPDGWLPTDDDIRVSFGNCYTQLDFGYGLGYNIHRALRSAGAKPRQTKAGNRLKLPFPSKFMGQCVKVYEPTHPLTEEFNNLTVEQEQLVSDIEKAHRVTKATLESVTTVKKLIEVWPEVEAFAKQYLENGERKAVLPAIPRADLNAQLGLPPKERAEVLA